MARSERLDEASLNRVIRNVNQDAIVRLLNKCYDSPMQFIDQKVEVRFLPCDDQSAYILYKGQHCPLRLTNRVANGKTRRQTALSIDYAKEGRMFTEYYVLSFIPFDKQNMKEQDSFRSKDHREMLSRLEYLKAVRGIGIFTARPGMEKIYTPRCFINGLNPNQ